MLSWPMVLAQCQGLSPAFVEALTTAPAARAPGGGQRARVGELVQNMDMVIAVIHQPANERRTDKTRATRDDDPHSAFSAR